MDPLAFLMKWYRAHCNDEWEHGFGIEIDTLDNPGWRCLIDLQDTLLENVGFVARVDGEDDDNYDDNGGQIGPWMTCTVNESKQFEITCGPLDLSRALGVFREWAVSVNPAWGEL